MGEEPTEGGPPLVQNLDQTKRHQNKFVVRNAKLHTVAVFPLPLSVFLCICLLPRTNIETLYLFFQSFDVYYFIICTSEISTKLPCAPSRRLFNSLWPPFVRFSYLFYRSPFRFCDNSLTTEMETLSLLS